MNIPQQIFAVFYAIFWGAVFSVSGRWKAFNFGLIFDKEIKQVSKRISLSLLILNILPILYFVGIFYILKGNSCEIQTKYWVNYIKMVLSGIIPAFAIFGFYRIWLGIVEKFAKDFYVNKFMIPHKYKPYRGADYEPEPSLRKLGIEPSRRYSWRKNIIVGIANVLVAFSGIRYPYYTIIVILIIIIFIYCSQKYITLINIMPIIILIMVLIIFSLSIYSLLNGNLINVNTIHEEAYEYVLISFRLIGI